VAKGIIFYFYKEVESSRLRSNIFGYTRFGQFGKTPLSLSRQKNGKQYVITKSDKIQNASLQGESVSLATDNHLPLMRINKGIRVA
jgi:hypothetical protein